ncbi:hypothetical protein NC653_005509 [Populus alba x Populus x berolinensis]|uniref:Uncharacterized protein n=1 Tax=Populus alba x Populus x berolinensis TaxID=444605 RepID=A0AAD6RCF6_9ROSI|nr:hypothetical protein NC653_005509 [Populus alba x Populus x berolinensis]
MDEKNKHKTDSNEQGEERARDDEQGNKPK